MGFATPVSPMLGSSFHGVFQDNDSAWPLPGPCFVILRCSSWMSLLDSTWGASFTQKTEGLHPPRIWTNVPLKREQAKRKWIIFQPLIFKGLFSVFRGCSWFMIHGGWDYTILTLPSVITPNETKNDLWDGGMGLVLQSSSNSQPHTISHLY